MAWLSDWKKRIKLTIDHTKIDSDLSNFPVMLSLNNYNAEVLFDEIDYSSVDDDFTAASGSAPNSDRWNDLSTNGFTIQGNRLYNATADDWELLRSMWVLSGDFDIQIDFDASNAPTTDGWYSRIYIRNSDSSIKQFIAINYTSGYKYASNYYDGGWGSEQKAATTDTTGKFRIVRSGSIITCYTWNGSGWDSRLARTYSSAPDIIVDFINGIPSGSTTFYFDNFKVNSGTICWPQGTHPNRKKVAITEEDGVIQCYAEIEHFDNVLKNIILWSKISTIVSGSNTDIYLYMDVDKPANTTYVGDINSTPARSVWDDNFFGVWHMNQDPTGGADCIKDSTSNINHGTPGGSMTTADLVDGVVGKALEFDGSDDLINYGSASGIDDISIKTIESIIYPTDLEGIDYGRIVSKQDSSVGWGFMLRGPDDAVQFYQTFDDTNGSWRSEVSSLTINQWQYVACFYDLSSVANNPTIFVNADIQVAVELSTPIGAADSDASIDLIVGDRSTSSSASTRFNGKIDEIRISNIARSASWIKATYYSNWDQLIVYESYYQSYKYYFAGYIFEDSVPVSRIVRAYNSSTGELVGEVTSSGTTGYYELNVSASGSHYLVCIDADELPDYNNLIISKATPYVNE